MNMSIDDQIDGGIYAEGLRDGRKESESTIAAQAAEIKLLRDALDQIKMDAEGALARREGVNANTTLHTIKNALKPQESEAQHG